MRGEGNLCVPPPVPHTAGARTFRAWRPARRRQLHAIAGGSRGGGACCRSRPSSSRSSAARPAARPTPSPGWASPTRSPSRARSSLTLWQGSWIAAWAVGVVVWGLILWAVIFHRKRGDRLPPQVRYNLPIEILYTVVPFVLIAVLFYFTAQGRELHRQAAAQPRRGGQRDRLPVELAVPVPAVPGAGVGDQVRDDERRAVDPGGERAAAGARDPDQETVQFNLTSTDVIHAFWVPRSCSSATSSPATRTTSRSPPTKTGTFTGHCSELCGLYHSQMLFTLKVVTPQQFQAYMAAQQAAQNSSGSTQ